MGLFLTKLKYIFGIPFQYNYKNIYERNRGGPYKTEPATDLTRWRLVYNEGRRCWKYFTTDEELKTEQSFSEKNSLGLLVNEECEILPSPKNALHKAANYYISLQQADGHWEGDYGGPLFITPCAIIVLYITDSLSIFNDEEKSEFIRYLWSVRTPDDGWGLHTEGPPTVFGCVLNYITLRILGVKSTDERLIKVRKFIEKLGGTLLIPSWGKFWLSVLGVYKWQGMHNLCPEIWLIPNCALHPSKMWCHSRQVALGMSFCYGYKFSCDRSLVKELQNELYNDFKNINWTQQRNNVAISDLYTPHSFFLNATYYILDIYEFFHVKFLRKKALNFLYENIKFDDENTTYTSIAPISKFIQMLIRWHIEGPKSKAFENHLNNIRQFIWMGVDGLKFCGTDGSQLWDTAFTIKAITENSEIFEEHKSAMKLAYNWIDSCQINENPIGYDKYYRHESKGGWPFSTKECGWIVADCTAEGLECILKLDEKLNTKLDYERLCNSIDLLLSMQNPSGGYSTYETKRAGYFLEKLNPAEIFGDIMIDYEYVECTSSVLQALHYFSKFYDYRKIDIKKAIEKGIEYIKSQQRSDGSYYGSWGVCFTYCIWFALEALSLKGLTYKNSCVVKKACDWLVSKQFEDGGWGEDFESCELKTYVPSNKSQLIQTCWALLALMIAKYPNKKIISDGIQVVLRNQYQTGDFKVGNIVGVFNKSCAIHYDSYRNVFPIRCLGRYINIYEKK